MYKKNTGFSRVLKSCHYSYKGLSAAVTKEAAFRQELYIAVVLIPASFFLPVTLVERVLMIVAILLVLCVELINSAIEAVVDRIGIEHHDLAGMAKDMASAAVFVSISICAVIWFSFLIF